MNISTTLQRTASSALCALSLLAVAPSSFAQRVLLNGPATQVTEADVKADAATRIGDASRATMLSRPGTVSQLAANVYVQRAMAIEAEKKGLSQGSDAGSILQLAREKALADLYWAEFDKTHQPSETALEAYAQATYRASSADILKAPERARVRHILLKQKSPENRAKLEAWLKQLQSGASFAALAAQYSEDAGSAAKGGDLGFVAAGMTVKEFEAALGALNKPGDLSPVVESEYGYHILQLEERRPEGSRQYDEMKDALMLNARSSLLREARSKEVQRLQEGMELNIPAIESYSSQFKPVEGVR